MVGLEINRELVDSAFGILSRQADRHFRSHLGGYPPRDRQQACPSDLEALHADAAICGIGFTMSFYLRGRAFATSPEYLDATRIGVMGGSLLSAQC